MSLHARITPEIQAKLNKQKRNASISAFMIAILICSLIVAILFYIALSPIFKNTTPLVSFNPVSKIKDKPTRPESENQVQTNPASTASSTSNVIITQVPAAVAVTVTMTDLPSLEYGEASDFGSDVGIGDYTGKSGSTNITFIPPDIAKRCSKKDRLDRLTKEGGKEEYEEQVVNALKWLQNSQASDGSWKAQGKPVAMTGLALLAYLGHCETPYSVEFGETIQNAILYLIKVSKENSGKLATNTADRHWCYEHGIATYALAEAYTLCKGFNIAIPGLEESVKLAGNYIIANQHPSGGWDYSYDISGKRGGDTSISCWQLQALKACKATQIEFNGLEKCAKQGVKYLESAKNGKGTIGYTPGNTRKTMTPGGVLCFQQWGKGNRSFARNGIKWISETNDFNYKKQANLYMHYYSSQAMINARGKAWADYNEKTMVSVADNQNTDGSWELPGGAGHGLSSKHYATCLCTLMMEVYYRFLPSAE